MAMFDRTRIPRGTMPQTAWKMIRERLIMNKSVEVVIGESDDEYTEFELRAWSTERKDKSNGPDAVPGNQY